MALLSRAERGPTCHVVLSVTRDRLDRTKTGYFIDPAWQLLLEKVNHPQLMYREYFVSQF